MPFLGIAVARAEREVDPSGHTPTSTSETGSGAPEVD
jgi:hypothetical protein